MQDEVLTLNLALKHVRSS